VTVNGAPPPASEYDDGRIYLRNLETDDSVLLGSTRLGAISGLVVPGQYEVYYSVETAGQIVPLNAGAYIGTIEVQPDVPVDLPVDIRTHDFAGVVTINDGAPPASDADRGLLLLEDAETDDVIQLGEVAAGSFSVPLMSGTYVMYYEVLQSSGGVPVNTHAAIGCFELGG
jgi:hypothetical protein